MTSITNPDVINYYTHLCSEWNITPTEKVSTGYESVTKNLMQLSKEAWTAADDAGKKAIELDAFNIYRSLNVLPINYYSLEGCVEEIKSIMDKNSVVDNLTLGVGNTAGQSFCRFWFPNMQEAYTRKDKEVSLHGRFHNDTKLKRAINLCFKHRDEGAKTVLPQNLRRALDLVSGGSIQNFKPMNARAIYEYICPTFMGRVLDFSSGYGGRMMGALTSNMRYNYTGIDPNTKTYNGLFALGNILDEVGAGSGFNMHHGVSEEFDADPKTYDAAFSSPPYFNLETYCEEETQCMNRCDNVDAWFELYVEPTLRMLHKVLDDGAIYAVNIADYKIDKDQFKIVDRWCELSTKMNFAHVENIKMMLNVRPGAGNNKAQNGYKFEQVYLFKKV
jgi:hypothetical protein